MLTDNYKADTDMRLDRLLVALAVNTRSQIRTIVRSGRIRINGQVVKDESIHVRPGDIIMLDGNILDARTQRHIMFYKPAGILTAARDPKQPTIFDVLPKELSTLGCMPVGRLDKDTSGLLLLTTDGELAHRLLSPKRHVWKTYRAVAEGTVTQKDVAAFERGIPLSDFTALPAKLDILLAGSDRSEVLVHVHEGKFHQVRRMLSAVGHEVITLHRSVFGPITLDPSLNPGDYRELTLAELDNLKTAVLPEEKENA